MKIIDLLNKIANGEEVPKKIYCFDRNFYLKGNTYFGDIFTLMHYIQEEDLNDTVEILEEENKIEKLYHCCMESDNEEINFLIKNINDLSDKFNEVIGEINKLKEK